MELKAHKSALTVDGVAILYAYDPELLAKWHIKAPCSAREAAASTLLAVYGSREFPDAEGYTLSYKGSVVGFFTLYNAKQNLGAFYLIPSARPILSEALWYIINRYMQGPIRTCGLYHRNVKAAKWLERHGAVSDYSDGWGSYFTWGKENNSCHLLEPASAD